MIEDVTNVTLFLSGSDLIRSGTKKRTQSLKITESNNGENAEDDGAENTNNDVNKWLKCNSNFPC